MITRMTKANADKYRVLFSEFTNILKTHDHEGKLVGEAGAGDPVISSEDIFEVVKDITAETLTPGIHYIKEGEEWREVREGEAFDSSAEYAIKIESDITNIDEYFYYLGEVMSSTAEAAEIYHKFTVLPLDEDFLIINANTRTIEVPKSFKDAGVSVQGDEVAEILYFKIDRYFDMDDLATKDILIQWRAPADKEGKRKEGFSKPWVVDFTSEPGYIIFGWPLASELTEFPGKIDFSVRFYTYVEEEEKRVTYSFSTLTSTVEIKEGLNYDLKTAFLDESSIIDSRDLIINRVVNSILPEKGAPEAMAPVIEEISFDIPVEEVKNEKGEIEKYNVYLTDSEGNEETKHCTIQAIVEDTGSINYTWIKKDSEGNYDQGSLENKTHIEFIEVDDTERVPNKVYYVKSVGNVYVPFKFTDDINSLEDARNEEIQLYERVSIVDIVPGVGSYQTRITNRLGRKISSTYSPIISLRAPIEPVITKDVESSGILDKNYKYTLNVEADVDDKAYTEYIFRKKKEDNSFEVVQKTTDPSYMIEGAAYGAEDDGDGFYNVIVRSKLNGISTDSEVGNTIRITHEASPVKITISEPTSATGKYSINKPFSISIKRNEFEEKNKIDSDIISYQWYKYEGTEEAQIEDINKALEGNYNPSVADKVLVGKNESKIRLDNTEETQSGYYFCMVTNNYNGSIITNSSPFFDVEDYKNL